MWRAGWPFRWIGRAAGVRKCRRVRWWRRSPLHGETDGRQGVDGLGTVAALDAFGGKVRQTAVICHGNYIDGLRLFVNAVDYVEVSNGEMMAIESRKYWVV